jgi:penicillin amidase
MRTRKLLLGAGATVAVLLVVAAAAAFLFLRSGRPLRGGEHALAGLDAPVSVRWDRWGVPAIRAENEADLAAAVGWIHANDRFTQMELGRRAAFGRLAEILGEPAFDTDVYFRRLGLGHTARETWDAAGPRTRVWLEAYARGVNARLGARGGDLPPELRLLGVEPEPWEGVHSVAFGLLMARDLSFWNDRPEEERFRWLAAYGPDAVRDVVDDPGVHLPDEVLALARGGPPTPVGAAEEPAELAPGSNNWAVGGSRTASGRPLVANDPHLGLFLPSVWYQVQLRAPGFEAAGMTLPGAPAVVLGRGAHVAWAFTNVMLDDHDLFLEELDGTGERYRRGDAWHPLKVDEQEIRIRGGESRTVTVRATDVGPLLEADEERALPPRSLAWTAYYGGDAFAALLDLARATTPDEAVAAIEPYVCPAQNLVAAFDTGELLYTVIGQVPERRRGDGRLPAPGWDETYGWDGLRPRAMNPLVVRPADDLLVTANNDVRPPGYEPSLVSEFYRGHRAARVREAVTGRGAWNWELAGELQNDVTSLYARDVLDLLDGAHEGDAGEAWQVLRSWDGAMTKSGPSALYALVQRELQDLFADEAEAAGLPRLNAFYSRRMLLRLLEGALGDRWFDDVGTPEVETREEAIAAALATAWREGSRRWGGDVSRWSWGELHRLTLRHRLDALPVLGPWMRRGPFEVAGAATTVMAYGGVWRGDHMAITYGPSMRWVTDWGHPEMAFAMLPGGQSGHPADPHYDDQVTPFLEGRLRPAPWSEEQIESATVTSMTLRPAD